MVAVQCGRFETVHKCRHFGAGATQKPAAKKGEACDDDVTGRGGREIMRMNDDGGVKSRRQRTRLDVKLWAHFWSGALFAHTKRGRKET